MRFPTRTLPSFIAAALSCLLMLGAAAQTPPVRILPIGDSITFGSGGTANLGGYRGTLYTLLTNAGYNVDYVGTQTGNSAGIPDQDHEGHGGWRIDQLDSNIEGWFGAFADPDVILLHIGTNDFGQGVDTVNAINRLDALILKMATLRPYAHIIVTNLMERGEPQNTAIETEFNPYVEARVNAHAAAGRRVTFVNMRSAVPLSDMPDNLHPNQTGYDKMANAWLPAIQSIVSPNGDAFPPALSRALASDITHVLVTFSKPVADDAANLANYAINGGVNVSAATLDAAKRTVTLTTSALTPSVAYSVTVNNIQDRIAPAANPIAPNSQATFFGPVQRGYLNNVPESGDYTLVTSLDVPNAANYQTADAPYAVDNRNGVGPFDRIAYYVELQQATGPLEYLWVSMDAFTNDARKISVPTLASGAIWQGNVTNMTVVSNHAGVVNGAGLAGNLEFWPTNYNATNGAGVPGASDLLYDTGDTPTPGNYGSMQVHNTASGQTLFAFNKWGGSAGNVCIGIGNDPAPVSGGADWTFHENASNYTVKTIQVLARTTGDLTAPTPSAARASFGRTQIHVTFSEPLAAASVNAAGFSLSNGVSVLGVTLAANQRDVLLLTTQQPAGTPLTLSVSGVRDTSPNANAITAGSTIAVGAPALPPEIIANVGTAADGYELVYTVNVPVTGNFNTPGLYAYDDHSKPGAFSRVAYYLELQAAGGPVQYIWVAMDALTIDKRKIGVPTLASGAVFQQNLSNLDVISNVPGVVNGTGITTGNIEFWPTNYSQPNALAVPNASTTAYDFGDTRSTTGNHGSMQIHNYGAGQTLFAINNWGADGNAIAIGIGNRPTADPDWTFAANAGTYVRRVLHVLALPSAPSLPPEVAANVPEAVDYQLVYSLNVPTTGNLVSGAGFTNYSINRGADIESFSRVAYYMELQKTGDPVPRYVWVSMDAFTTSALRIGVPTAASGAVFQQRVNNMNVLSNVAGVVTGNGIATGNIEFWPTNYTAAVTAGVLPGNPGSGTAFDFNDTRSTTGTHGSMQVHNYGAGQTLFGISNWGTAANSTNVLSMGIGNNPSGAPDYTLTANGTSWDIRRVLHVFVKPGSADFTGPAITGAKGSTALNRLVVSFNEPIADSAADPAKFTISGGVTVTGARLLPGNTEVALSTTAQTGGSVYSVGVTGVRDRSPAGNLIAGGASASFTAYTPPAILANVPDAGYELIYQLAIPSATPQWNLNAIPYSVNEAKFGERSFDRVAYLMALDGNWVYVSFDAHTNALSKIGVPTLGVTATAFQQFVSNMNVASNVPGITTGSGIATGNIEFWGGNYSGANALNIPNGNATTFDFGDTMTTGGYGSMQIHNHGAAQVLMAYNNWGSNANDISEVGIGNHPTPSATAAGAQLDWTFSDSATLYAARNLYVLARPAPGNLPGPFLATQPKSRVINDGDHLTLSVAAAGTGPFTYQWRRNGNAITGQTNSWLDLSALGIGNAGTYDVVVTAPNGGSTVSRAATLDYNHPPAFAGYFFTVERNSSAAISRSALLLKAADTDGDSIVIAGIGSASSSGGSVALDASTVTFTPLGGFLGADTFTLTLTDNRGGTTQATVNATVTAASLNAANGAAAAARPSGAIDLLFFVPPGSDYRIRRSSSLAIPYSGWTTLGTFAPGDDGIIPFTDFTPSPGAGFYIADPAPGM